MFMALLSMIRQLPGCVIIDSGAVVFAEHAAGDTIAPCDAIS
jgi:hypothetical protein